MGEQVVVQVSATVLDRAEPGSVLVLEVPEDVSADVAVQVRDAVAAAIPDTRVLVLAGARVLGLVGSEGVPSLVRGRWERYGVSIDSRTPGEEGVRYADNGFANLPDEGAGRLARWAAVDLLEELRSGRGAAASSVLGALDLAGREPEQQDAEAAQAEQQDAEAAQAEYERRFGIREFCPACEEGEPHSFLVMAVNGPRGCGACQDPSLRLAHSLWCCQSASSRAKAAPIESGSVDAGGSDSRASRDSSDDPSTGPEGAAS